MNRKETAEYYRIGVFAGLISAAEAVSWVDSVVINEDKPESAFVEASMCGKRPEELMAHLAEVEGEADRDVVLSSIFATMLARVEYDKTQYGRIARTLQNLSFNGYAPRIEAEDYMSSVRDDYELAVEGIYGHVQEIERELLAFLRLHAEVLR